MADRAVEPFAVAQLVESYVDSELRDAEKFSNRAPLDDSGVFDLHTLASKIYALGFNDGVTTEGWRQHNMQTRAREQARSSSAKDADT